MKEEIWKPVKDFESFYEASSFGRVRRNWHGKWKYLKTEGCCGYHKVKLSKNGVSKSQPLHYLILETFRGIDFETLPKNLETHHVDGNPSNNRVDNLIVITKLDHQKLSTKRRFENWKRKTAQRIRYEKIISQKEVKLTPKGRRTTKK